MDTQVNMWKAGEFTITQNVASVVDCIIMSTQLFYTILNFEVLNDTDIFTNYLTMLQYAI